MKLSHHFCHDFNGALRVEAFAWANAHEVGDFIQLLLAGYRKVCALGQKLSEQAIDVLIAAALPRGMRITEVNSYASLLCDLGVFSRFSSLAIGHAFSCPRRPAVRRSTEAIHCRGGIARSFDQIVLLIPAHKTVLNLPWMNVNADHVGNLTATFNTSSPRQLRALILTQTDTQLLMQFACRKGIDRVLVGFAADVSVFNAGDAHAAQLAGNLLGRKSLSQQCDDQYKQLTAGQQSLHWTASLARLNGFALSLMGCIRTRKHPVSAKLLAHSGWAKIQQTSDNFLAQPMQLANLDRKTFFDAEFVIGPGGTLPNSLGVVLSFRGHPCLMFFLLYMLLGLLWINLWGWLCVSLF